MSTLTKTFIFLTLLFSLALAIILLVGIQRIAPYKENLTTYQTQAAASAVELQAAQNAQAAAEAQLATARAQLEQNQTQLGQEITRLNAQLGQAQLDKANLEATNSQLTNANTSANALSDSLSQQLAAANKEIATIRPELVSLTQKNADLNRINNELQTQERLAEQAIRKLQEAVQANTGPGGAALNTTNGQVTESNNPSSNNANNAAPSSANAINGKITNIAQSAGHTLIETKLGSTSGVKDGDHFAIYRAQGGKLTWVADAQVSRVTDDASVATVTTANDGMTPQTGDVVMSSPANASAH